MALDRLGDFEEHVDFADFSFARTQAFHHTPHPARAFTAGRALTAAFMFVEIRQARNGANNISGLVHDNDGCSTEPRTEFLQAIEIHGRSEEHTSELQSLMRNSYAVFCFKKNTT